MWVAAGGRGPAAGAAQQPPIIVPVEITLVPPSVRSLSRRRPWTARAGALISPSLDSTGTLGAAEAQTKEIPPVLLLIDSKRRMYSGGAPMHRPASLRGHLPLRPQPPYGRSSPR